MTREQYEQRKQKLDEQLRSGIELLEAAHQYQVRALELVWSMSAEEALPSRVPPVETAYPPDGPVSPAPVPSRPRRRGAGELVDEVEAVLRNMPEKFDRSDVCQALGYEPDRASLFRVFQKLKEAGTVSVVKYGSGRVPTVYAKTGTFDSPSEA
jgi:hypothetical protein